MTSYIDTHADDQSVRWVHLYQLDLSDTLRWTDDALPVFDGVNWWTPYVVRVEAIATEQGQIQGASLTIGSADNLFANYVFASDLTGSVIQVWQAWLDPAVPDQVPQEVRQVFLGRVTGVQLVRQQNSSEVKLTLGPYADPNTKVLPTRSVAALIRH